MDKSHTNRQATAARGTLEVLAGRHDGRLRNPFRGAHQRVMTCRVARDGVLINFLILSKF